MKDLMKQFAVNERGTTYFRDYAINQIRIAHRLKEYLNPDPYFPSTDLSKQNLDFFIDREVEQAVDSIIKELNINIGCSQGSEAFRQEAVLLASEMLI